MSEPNLSLQGFPARFAAVRTATSTVLTHTLTPTNPNSTYVLEGVDVSCYNSISPINRADAWISLGSTGTKCYFWQQYVDPATILPGRLFGSWRGNLPFYDGDTLEVGVECLLGSDLAIHAYGIWMPLPLLVSL